MSKKILITGGAGFIGTNWVLHFLNNGWQVTVLDNLSRRGVDLNLNRLNEMHPNKFAFVKADVRHDQDILDREAALHDAILHLAGQVAVTTSVADPRTDFEVNALGTFNVLEAVRKASTPPVIIYSSTNKVYGDLEALEIEEGETRYHLKHLPNGVTERQQLDFHSPYGCSKGAADKYVRDYSRIYNLPTVVFRQSCIYGQNQFGIEDQGWLAWFTIATLFKKPITLYGNGKQVRDVLHVEDLVSLYERAIDRIDDARGHAFNVGGGKSNSISILEFFEALEGSHGLRPERSFGKTRPGDQKVFISDNAKVKDSLKWSPQISFDDGFSSLVDWTKNNMSRIKTLY